MSWQSLSAIVPMSCVAAAAIAAMVAEAFRDPGERMPIAPLGAIGLIGAGVASVLLWNSNASSFDMVVLSPPGSARPDLHLATRQSEQRTVHLGLVVVELLV